MCDIYDTEDLRLEVSTNKVKGPYEGLEQPWMFLYRKILEKRQEEKLNEIKDDYLEQMDLMM